MIERVGFGKILDRLPKFIGHIYTLLIVLFGWVFFRADTLGGAVKYLGEMFNFANFGITNALSQLDNLQSLTIFIGIIACMPVVKYLAKLLKSRGEGGEATVNVLSTAATAAMFCFAIICLTGSDYNPFIYFRF